MSIAQMSTHVPLPELNLSDLLSTREKGCLVDDIACRLESIAGDFHDATSDYDKFSGEFFDNCYLKLRELFEFVEAEVVPLIYFCREDDEVCQ